MVRRSAWRQRATRRAILAAGVWGAGLAAACGPVRQAPPPAARVAAAREIEFYHQQSANFVDAIVGGFHAAQSRVKVNSVFVAGGYEGIIEKVQVLVLGGNPPAVAQSGFTYTQFWIKHIPSVPIASFLEAEKLSTADVFPSMLKLGQDAKGKLWAWPLAVSTPVTYYNAALLRARGLNPDRPPRTWEEVRTHAKQLTQGEQKGVCYNHSITGNWLFQAMVECAGGKMVTPDGKKARFHEEPGVRSLTYWADLVQKDQSKVLQPPGVSLFYDGHLALLVTTSAGLETTRLMMKWAKEDLRTTIFPTDGTKPRRVPAGGNNLFITAAEAAQREAAWEFVRHFVTPEGTTSVAQASGYMAVRKAALTTPALMGNALAADPAKRSAYDQINEMVPWHEFDTKEPVAVRKLILDAQTAAMEGKATPKRALEEAAAEVQKLLNP